MAYDGRFTSIKPIVENVYRDAGIEEINFETALEDTAELIGLLGIPYAYVDKNTNGTDEPILQVIDYRAYLPDDVAYVIDMQKITLNGNNQIIRTEEMVENPSVFHYNRLETIPEQSYVYPIASHPLSDFDGNTFKTSMSNPSFTANTPVRFSGEVFGGVSEGVTYYIKEVVNSYEFSVSATLGSQSLSLDETSGTMYVTNLNTNETLTVIETSGPGDYIAGDGMVVGSTTPTYRVSPYGYRINNNVIFTEFKEGYINLAYKAYPIDDDGYLLVPDDEKLRAAVKYHLIYKIDYRNWRVNPASPGMKALLNDSEQKRDYYAAAARNKANIPNVAKMESIKNRWVSLIPRINEHRNGFTSLNKQEQRRY